uniref:hypothetical protein n=1 Tax=Barnesiella intestinihominis TaxID=487174 RepID=UPI003FEE12B3
KESHTTPYNWNAIRIGSNFSAKLFKKQLQSTRLQMRNNAAYLPENPIVYIIFPESIHNRASFAIFVNTNIGFGSA